jgi:hypothetical protein
VVVFVGKQKTGRRHRCEELQQLRTSGTTEVLHVSRDVVEYGKQRRVDGIKPAFACRE